MVIFAALSYLNCLHNLRDFPNLPAIVHLCTGTQKDTLRWWQCRVCVPIKTNQGFSVLPQDMSNQGWKQSGINLPTLCVMDAVLYLLSRSRLVIIALLYLSGIFTYSHMKQLCQDETESIKSSDVRTLLQINNSSQMKCCIVHTSRRR